MPFVFCGIFLVIAAVVFLLWNEERSLRRAELLDEALYKCRPLSNTEIVFDSNNGHLVHLTGPLTTDEPLEDSQYGVTVRAVRLRRTVEMYQWVEYRHVEEYEEYGEKKQKVTYHYMKKWMPRLVPSTLFFDKKSHQNPSQFPIEQKDWEAHRTAVGSFYLSSDMYQRKVLDVISDWKPVQLSLTREMKQQGMKLLGNQIYYSRKPWFPDIGDIWVGHEFAGMSDSANPNHVSIIASQSSGGQLTTYYSADMGEELLLLHFGVESCEEMLNIAKRSNVMMRQLYRGIGSCTSFIGFLILTNLILGGIPEINNGVLLLLSVWLASLITIAITSPKLCPRLPWLYFLLQPYHIWLLNERARNP